MTKAGVVRQLMAAAALLAFAVACGGGDEDPVSGVDLDGVPNGVDTLDLSAPVLAEGPCVDGATEECRVPLGTQGDVHNCFVGVQVCVDSTWSSCVDPEDAALLTEDAEVTSP